MKKEESSLALDILRDFKKQNKRLFIANIVLAIALIISLGIIVFK